MPAMLHCAKPGPILYHWYHCCSLDLQTERNNQAGVCFPRVHINCCADCWRCSKRAGEMEQAFRQTSHFCASLVIAGQRLTSAHFRCKGGTYPLSHLCGHFRLVRLTVTVNASS